MVTTKYVHDASLRSHEKLLYAIHAGIIYIRITFTEAVTPRNPGLFQRWHIIIFLSGTELTSIDLLKVNSSAIGKVDEIYYPKLEPTFLGL